MKISILTGGSRGDVEPIIAVAEELATRGHQIRLSLQREFESLVSSQQIELRFVSGASSVAVSGDDRERLRNSPAKIMHHVLRYPAGVEERLEELYEHCIGSDLLLFNSLAGFTPHFAEALGIPCIGLFLNPIIATRVFPRNVGPLWLQKLDGSATWNYLSHIGFAQLGWFSHRRWTNAWRNKRGLTSLPLWYPVTAGARWRSPVVFGFSRHLVPRPEDWPAHLRVTGFWTRKTEPFIPSTELSEFIENSSPPIFVGFSSTPIIDSEFWNEKILPAIALSKQRAVLGLGYTDVSKVKMALPDSVHVVSAVPFEWLFPRVSMAIHHGGIGTIAHALRAGIPSIVIPHSGEQRFWGLRLSKLGLSPAPVAPESLDPRHLADLILRCQQDQTLREKNKRLSHQLREEKGLEEAVDAIMDFTIFLGMRCR